MDISAIIVEDEPLSRAFLKNLLAEFCPQIKVLAAASTEDEAVELIESLKPALVFMDIELQQGTGFGVLQRTRQLGYHVIFTTALDYTGIRSLQFSGVDYIQKPIDIESLQVLIKQMDCGDIGMDGKIAVGHLLDTLDHQNKPSQLLVNTETGRTYIPLDEIIYLESQRDDVIFYMIHASVIALGRNLKDYEKLFDDVSFFRPHPNYIIQLNKVLSASRENKVKMVNHVLIPVSPKKESQLNELLFNPA